MYVRYAFAWQNLNLKLFQQTAVNIILKFVYVRACVHVCHIVQYPMPKATNKVNKTDTINKINAICFSVRANCDFAVPIVVASS